MPWIGPFIVEKLTDNNTCVLKRGNRVLKTKQHIKNIKKFYEPIEDISEHGPFTTLENPVDNVSLELDCQTTKKKA